MLAKPLALSDAPPPMTAIRIVCSFDAAETAETLMRLLTAEQHDVRICKGRQSLAELPTARNAKEAVLLIWSKEARGAQYMRDWCDATDAARLIEIARAPSWPRNARRAPVVDFTHWRGERGGKAWAAMKDRLRQVTSLWEPAKPPPIRTFAAVGMAGACAIAGAFAVGVTDRAAEPLPESNFDLAAFDAPPEHIGGMGGVIDAVEPPSAEDLNLPLPARLRAPAYAPLTVYVSEPLAEVPEMRDPTLIERLIALNPLARD